MGLQNKIYTYSFTFTINNYYVKRHHSFSRSYWFWCKIRTKYTRSSHSHTHTLTLRLCRVDQSLGHGKLTQNRVKISKVKNESQLSLKIGFISAEQIELARENSVGRKTISAEFKKCKLGEYRRASNVLCVGN